MMSEAMLKKAKSHPDKEYDFFQYLVRHFMYYHCEPDTPLGPATTNAMTGQTVNVAVLPMSSISTLYDRINWIYSEWVGRVKVVI